MGFGYAALHRDGEPVYVPTSGRCDQHAVEIDGERVGLLSASQIGVRVRERVSKRPSVAAAG